MSTWPSWNIIQVHEIKKPCHRACLVGCEHIAVSSYRALGYEGIRNEKACFAIQDDQVSVEPSEDMKAGNIQIMVLSPSMGVVDLLGSKRLFVENLKYGPLFPSDPRFGKVFFSSVIITHNCAACLLRSLRETSSFIICTFALMVFLYPIIRNTLGEKRVAATHDCAFHLQALVCAPASLPQGKRFCPVQKKYIWKQFDG